MSCGVGQRLSSDLALLWLWCRPAGVAPIGPLAWETPYAMGMALKRKKKKKRKEKAKKGNYKIGRKEIIISILLSKLSSQINNIKKLNG